MPHPGFVQDGELVPNDVLLQSADAMLDELAQAEQALRPRRAPAVA